MAVSVRTSKKVAEMENGPRPEYHATVHDIPEGERPRERLQKYGAESMALADLLAIILRVGTQRENVIEMATKLLIKYGGLGGLMSADFHELCTEYGLGMAKAAQLKAALEIGRRVQMEQPDKRYRVRSADDAAHLVRMELMYLGHEELHILLLDTKHQLIERIKRYKGTVNSSVLRGSEIFRPAVVRNTPNIIVCHNHPSGDPSPSPEDLEVTEQLVRAGKLLDIDLLDHIIIGNPRYISLREQLHW